MAQKEKRWAPPLSSLGQNAGVGVRARSELVRRFIWSHKTEGPGTIGGPNEYFIRTRVKNTITRHDPMLHLNPSFVHSPGFRGGGGAERHEIWLKKIILRWRNGHLHAPPAPLNNNTLLLPINRQEEAGKGPEGGVFERSNERSTAQTDPEFINIGWTEVGGLRGGGTRPVRK